MRLTPLVFALGCAAATLYAAEEFKTSNGTLKITPIKHASLMIEAGGKVIQLDPWSGGNQAQGTQAKYAALPKADLILITDFHPDHMDTTAIGWVKKPGTKIIAPFVVTSGLKTGDTIKNGETQTWGAFTIEAVPMYNLQRGPKPGTFFHDKGRGNGYVVTYGGKRFYFSGDTEAIPEMKALKNIDVAFVCMNVPYTMTPEEAAEGVKAFAPKIVYPFHYRGSDLKVFETALKGLPIEVRILDWYK
jgi:L-ascorbate metabolism protein UlaG (beta-lactamase superfamily)